MGTKKVAIIGGGVAGISAGCYLQKNGFETTIYEKASEFGGLCAFWQRKNYIFDMCMHMFCGVNANSSFYKLWNELGIYKYAEMREMEFIKDIEYEKDKYFRMYCDLEKFKNELIRVAPEDEKVIQEFIDGIIGYPNFNELNKPKELMTMQNKLSFMSENKKAFQIMKYWSGMTVENFLDLFHDKHKMGRIFYSLITSGEKMTMSYLMPVLAELKAGGIGLPVGGAKALIEALIKCYDTCGGRVINNSEVKKVLIEDGKATGIELTSGNKLDADIVISACDGFNTIYKLVGEEYIYSDVLKTYEILEPNISMMQISLGIAKELDSDIHSINYMCDEKIKVDDQYTCDYIDVRIIRNDHVKLPKGKTIMEVNLYASYEYWMNLRNTDKERYNKEKQRIADIVIDSLDQRFHIKEAIEVIDISTPATIKNYTDNRNGSILGWLSDKVYENVSLKMKFSQVKNLYMTGLWAEFGASLPGSARLGKDIAHIICHDNKIEFK